jgi:hypothetical protein
MVEITFSVKKADQLQMPKEGREGRVTLDLFLKPAPTQARPPSSCIESMFSTIWRACLHPFHGEQQPAHAGNTKLEFAEEVRVWAPHYKCDPRRAQAVLWNVYQRGLPSSGAKGESLDSSGLSKKGHFVHAERAFCQYCGRHSQVP